MVIFNSYVKLPEGIPYYFSWFPSEKYNFVSWGDEIPNIWKN